MAEFDIVYQTLEDRDNPDVVERDGPFPCKRSLAWLGLGYYFWDTHIELGHWWGRKCHAIKGYIICRAFCLIDHRCWDLHGKGKHRIQFEEVVNEMIDSGMTSGNSEIKVAQVIEWIKKKPFFNYEAIRANGVESVGPKDQASFRLGFDNQRKQAYFEVRPAVQICFIKKRGLDLENYKVVFPDHHVEDQFF